jgi:Recombination endonuclease VII
MVKSREERNAYVRHWYRNQSVTRKQELAAQSREYRENLSDEQREQKQDRARTQAVKKWAESTASERAQNYKRLARWRKNNPRAYTNLRLKARYGISIEQWEAMFEAQGRKCACCGSDDPKSKKGWQTDHCHETGLIRGILCAPCNRALGHSQEDSARLQALVRYLATHVGADAHALNMECNFKKRKRDYRKVHHEPFASHSWGSGVGYRFYGQYAGASAGLI